MCSAPVAGPARYLMNVDRHPLASVATLVLGLRCSWQGEERLVEPRPPFRYFILRLVLGGRHDVLAHNGFDGGVTGSGDIFRVDDLEGWRRGNASEGRSPPDPANDVAASAVFQHPIDRRPPDLESLGVSGAALYLRFQCRSWPAPGQWGAGCKTGRRFDCRKTVPKRSPLLVTRQPFDRRHHRFRSAHRRRRPPPAAPAAILHAFDRLELNGKDLGRCRSASARRSWRGCWSARPPASCSMSTPMRTVPPCSSTPAGSGSRVSPETAASPSRVKELARSC